MKSWLKRIRGVVGMGMTWAVGWAPIGGIVGMVVGGLFGFPVARIALGYAVMFGVLGFSGGTIFSTLVRIAEGRSSFDELSLPRFATLGGLGGLTLGLLAVAINVVGLGGVGITPITIGVIIASGLLGAGSAAGSLALARQADDQELLAAGRAGEEAGLTEHQEENLLAARD